MGGNINTLKTVAGIEKSYVMLGTISKQEVCTQWLVDINGEWGMTTIGRTGDGCGTQETHQNIAILAGW